MAAVMIGVDPHKSSHTAVAIGPAEEPLGEVRVRACPAQAGQLVRWAAAWPERIWAVEGAAGLGHLLAQQLVAARERVLDVPPKLAARVRLLEAGDTNKNDPNDALPVAVAAPRTRARREVRAEDHAAVLKVWAKRHRDLARARNQVTCRLHAVLCDLVPGGVDKEITAGQAARVLDQVTPADAVALATDAGSGVYYQTYSATGAGAFGTTTGGATVAPVIAAEGTTTVFFQATDNWYNSNSFQAATVRIDKTPPTIATAPTVKLRNNTGPVKAADPVTISWSGSDATSGINHYSLYESKDGGAYTLAATTTAPMFNKNLGPGHTYQFEVTATDNAGNTSAAKQGVVYKLSLFQENASAIKYTTPGWTRQTLSGANGGSVDFATLKGKTVTLTFTGFQVAWMSTQGPTRGSATVKLDSGTAATISTNTSSAHAAEVVDVVTAAAQGSHKLVVNVLGTSGHPRIDVDAFIVLSK